MAAHSRYDVSGDASEGVLKNKLKITDQQRLENTETLLLEDAYTYFFELLKIGSMDFNADLILQIHHYFLTTLYTWAGTTRTVNLSKGTILFCPHSQIKDQLKKFKKILKQNIPTSKSNKRTVSEKLAVIHCEFNAIHPFREGNGRTIRLFLDLIAAQCGFSGIDYGKNSKNSYIKACIAGMSKNYAPMQKIIQKGLAALR